MLTYKEFIKLPENEREERFKELDNHERFMWRTNCSLGIPKDVKNSEMTSEQIERVTKMREKLLKEGKITKEQFDEFQHS